MPTNPNMVAIQTVTVGSGGAASIEFTSIPQTYTDLVVMVSARNDAAVTNGRVDLQPNGLTTNRTSRYIFADGSSANSGTDTEFWTYCPADSATASTFGNSYYYIPNYTSSDYKSISADGTMENNATGSRMNLSAFLWSNTSAITSIKLVTVNNNNGASANFKQYSTATLYGVTSSAYGAKATGGIISSDANYYYHTFLASGTFTPTQSLTADCLVIAGGGGGGTNYAGGGGAGGLLAHTSQSLTATGYTVTVGGGGGTDTQGSNSQFGSLTASVGGGLGGAVFTNGGTGGSGGGGGYSTQTGGSATSGQGYAGGASNTAAGGGGGAGAVGQAGASSEQGGAGGVGSSSYSAWGLATGAGELVSGTYYFAGGGGGTSGASKTGGAGGLGGGGKGANDTGAQNTTNVAGTTNTGGGGGGGSRFSGAGKSGGSGIVIVRYAK